MPYKSTSTIQIKTETYEQLNKYREPKQSWNNFILSLIDYIEQQNNNNNIEVDNNNTEQTADS